MVYGEGGCKTINRRSLNPHDLAVISDLAIVYLFPIAAVFMSLSLPGENVLTALFYGAVILGAVGLAALAERSRNALVFNVLLWMSFSILFFVLGFRAHSGIDDAAYMNIFQSVSEHGCWDFSLMTKLEPGYVFLNALVGRFTDKYLWLQIITSFLSLFLFYHAFRKYSSMISLPMGVFLLSTMLYFQMLSVALVRMFIALGIVVNAYYYIPLGNRRRYIILLLLAGSFHYSALFMLALSYFFIGKQDFGKKARRFTMLMFFATPILFIIIAQCIVPVLGGRHANYGVIKELQVDLTSFNTIPWIILLMMYAKRFSGKKSCYYQLFIAIYTLSFIIPFFGSTVSLGRLIFYAYTAFILVASMVSKQLSSGFERLMFNALVIFYGFLYLYRTQFMLGSHVPYLFPYRNIFFII